MRIQVFGACIVLGSLLGCASGRGTEDYAERKSEMERSFGELAQQKAALWELGFQPQEFEFDGQGKVTVSEWSLTGWPGEVHVNARIEYRNTTEKPVEHAIVWLEVLDSHDRVAGSSGVRLINPLGYPLWPGHTVTMEVRTPTNNAHLDPAGWQWGIACEALVDKEPGFPPALVDRGEWQRGAGRPAPYEGSYYRRTCPTVASPALHVPGTTRYR